MKYTCDDCNTVFDNGIALDDHLKQTGHENFGICGLLSESRHVSKDGLNKA